MEGMQDQRVLVAAKHFPGHGDTDTDSHRALPVIPTISVNDSIPWNLFPFREAIDRGLTGIMVAHLRVPSPGSTGEPGHNAFASGDYRFAEGGDGIQGADHH